MSDLTLKKKRKLMQSRPARKTKPKTSHSSLGAIAQWAQRLTPFAAKLTPFAAKPSATAKPRKPFKRPRNHKNHPRTFSSGLFDIKTGRTHPTAEGSFDDAYLKMTGRSVGDRNFLCRLPLRNIYEWYLLLLHRESRLCNKLLQMLENPDDVPEFVDSFVNGVYGNTLENLDRVRKLHSANNRLMGNNTPSCYGSFTVVLPSSEHDLDPSNLKYDIFPGYQTPKSISVMVTKTGVFVLLGTGVSRSDHQQLLALSKWTKIAQKALPSIKAADQQKLDDVYVRYSCLRKEWLLPDWSSYEINENGIEETEPSNKETKSICSRIIGLLSYVQQISKTDHAHELSIYCSGINDSSFYEIAFAQKNMSVVNIEKVVFHGIGGGDWRC